MLRLSGSAVRRQEGKLAAAVCHPPPKMDTVRPGPLGLLDATCSVGALKC